MVEKQGSKAVDTTLDTKSELNSGVLDSRFVPMSRLARDEHGAVAAGLRNVLPGVDKKRVTTTAFTSAI